MAFASLFYGFHYATGFFLFGDNKALSYIFNIAGSSIAGFSASFLWVSLGRYVHKACHLYEKENEKGHYFGVFNSIYFLNCVLGGVVVTFGLEIMTHQNYFILLTCIAVLGFLFAAVFLSNIQLAESETEKTQLTCKHILLSTLKFYPTMLPVLGLIFIDGINLAVQSSTIIHLITKTKDKTHDDLLSGFAIISYGFGSLIGGYVGGKLCDKFQLKTVAFVGVLLFGLCCSTMFVASFINLYPVTLFVFLFFGFQYSYITGCELVICSRTFKGAPESFAIVKQFHCFAYVVYEIVVLSTDNSIPLKFIMPFLLMFTIPASMGLAKLPAEEKKKGSLLESD